MCSVLRKVLRAAGCAVLLAALAAPVFADSGDDGDHGHNAPEVPVALAVPAAGAVVLGARIAAGRRRH